MRRTIADLTAAPPREELPFRRVFCGKLFDFFGNGLKNQLERVYYQKIIF